MKKRTILCVDQNETALTEDQCDASQKPSDYEQCSSVLPPCIIEDNDSFSDNEIADSY